MKNSKIILICVFLLGCVTFGYSQSKAKVFEILNERSQNQKFKTYSDLLTINKEFDNSVISKEVSKATIFNLNKQRALEIIKQSYDLISLEVKLNNNEIITLDLYKEVDAFSSLSVSTSDGKGFDMSNFKAAFYRGVIRGNENSLVSLSLFENEITGFISSKEGNLVFGKLKNYDQIILYNDKDLKQKPSFDCSNQNTPLKESEIVNYQNVFSKAQTIKCVRLYFETEFDIFQNLGNSTANVLNYVTNLYNQVGTLYTNDGISTKLSDILVWNTEDPYNALQTYPLLLEFQAHTDAINGDLGQLITFRSVGGGMAGGNFNGICNPWSDGSLAVSGNMSNNIQNVPLYSWNVYVVSHEFGHLFGSRHTHACVWNGNNTAIDSCSGETEDGCPLPGNPGEGGTIMSYCHQKSVGINFSLGFGPQPTAVITNNVNNGTCLSSCVACPSSLVITTNVTSGQDIKQAVNTIVATNTINSGTTAIYHAPSVTLRPSFNAKAGSIVRIYTDGCTNSFVAKQSQDIKDTSSEFLIEKEDLKTKFIYILPNPNNGIFKISLNDVSDGTIQITDLFGFTIYKLDFKNQTEFEMNMQEKPKGIYIVKVTSGEQVFTSKIIKN
jgi:Metallo-peptidase family M12/Secretion system C-terminal sorting domain